MDIGFDGETVEGMRSQCVERERWPSRIKEILRARDRGKCAACGVAVLDFLARKLPNGRAVVYQDNKAVDHMLASGLPDADAILMAAEEGCVDDFASQFHLVTPSPTLLFPFGYAVARGESKLLLYFNTWLLNAEGDGTIDELYRYWMLGEVK
jgi:ABC-type amino acid transport substrate-binding protein